MNFYFSISDILALLALILSAYSFKKIFDFNKKQNEFIETNDKLNKLLIEKEKEDLHAKKSADISANFIKLGRSDYRIKVFNRGQSTARNVRIEILEGKDLFFKDDINSKFPIETLERHQGIELNVPLDNQSPDKAKIKFIWDDETEKDKYNIVTIVI